MKQASEITRNASIRHLMMLAELSRCQSITEASERLFLSKAAVTSALKEVETRLSCTLFTRSNRGINLTAQGEIFSARCRRAENQLRGFQRFALGNSRTRLLPRRLSDSQLRALIEVTRYQNYSLAAHHTGLAQPTLHRSIRELEDLLGQALFRRSGRGVEATAVARKLSRLANLAYAEIQQGIDELQFDSGIKTGQLRIGCLPMARTDLLPESISNILNDFPSARISVVDGPYDEQLGLLLQGELDLIIGALREPAPTPEIKQQALFSDSLGVVVRAGHPYLMKKKLRLDQLAQLDWIAPRSGTPTRDIFEQLLGSTVANSGRQPIECSSMVAIRGLLARTDRAVLISIRQMRPELETGQVAVLPIRLPQSDRMIGYSTRQNWQPTPLQEHFLAILPCQEPACVIPKL